MEQIKSREGLLHVLMDNSAPHLKCRSVTCLLIISIAVVHIGLCGVLGLSQERDVFLPLNNSCRREL